MGFFQNVIFEMGLGANVSFFFFSAWIICSKLLFSAPTYLMAEESTSSPVTPDIIRPDGGNSRRNPLAGAGSANSREKTFPLYLRASTGSCHDFCKYGKKHESEEKVRHPFPRRIIKKPCDEPNLFESLDMPSRKKTSAIKSKSFHNSRTHTLDTSEVIKLQVSTDSPDGNNSRILEVLSKKEKTSMAKLKSKHSPNSRSHSHDTSDVIKLEVPTDSSDSKTSRKHEILSKEKKTSMEKLRSSPNLKSRFSNAPKQQDGSSSSERVGVSSKEVSSKPKEKSFCKWPTTSLKLKSQAEKHPSASVPSEGLNVRRNSGISDMKMGKRTATSKVSVKKALSSPRSSLSPRASLARATSLTARKNMNLKVVPPQKNQNKVKKADNEHDEHNNDTPQEKTLGRDQDESEYTVTEAEDDSDSEYDETVNMEEAEILEGENGGRPRKARMVFSNVNDCQPVKLSFSRGKVIDIQSDNNGPRRLKLRQGRVLGENQNVKAERRTFRSRGGDGDTNDNKTSGEKVVLRHQDVQGKKDERGLFNNVIEETASKLVETRKSKVKALVGAFETVISLQHTKPSANTVT
ncbi:hypothetical protein CRYUN_Cryun24cG0096700 [Craigia yunnanensis]